MRALRGSRKLKLAHAWGRPLAVSSLLLAAAGCGSLPAPADPSQAPSVEQQEETVAPDFGEYFTLRVPGALDQAKLSGARLHGVDVEVSRFDDGYRGRARMAKVDLRSNSESISGSVDGRTELHVEDKPGLLVVRGLYNGKLGQLEVSDGTIAGGIGGCRYDLRRQKGRLWYRGMRACGRQITDVRLALPKELSARPVEDRATLLVLFLGR